MLQKLLYMLIYTHTICTHSVSNSLPKEMKVAQMQPSLRRSITQGDLAEETGSQGRGYHQIPCKAGKYKTKIFQINCSAQLMSNVMKKESESNQPPAAKTRQTGGV